MQVVMHAPAPRRAEEQLDLLLQLHGTQGIRAADRRLATAEQGIEVVFDIALATAQCRRIAQHHQQPHDRLQPAGGDVVQQTLEQFDRCGLVAMNAGRQQQVDARVAPRWRVDQQHPFGLPLQAGAGSTDLDLLRRLAPGQSQLKQFAQSKHGRPSLRPATMHPA
ncbi:hypothetical protein D3C78_1078530 [compost metagenome]